MPLVPLRRRSWACLGLGLLWTGIAHAQAADDLSDVRLGPGDVVRLEVATEPSLSGQFELDAEGRVLFPLLGFVQVGDRPFGRVRAEIASHYAEQLVDPVIRLTPLFRVAILGEVRRPGVFPLDPTFTVADAIATAGGLLPSASWDRISLYRGGEVLRTRLDPESRALELPIRSGDQILVGRRSWLSQHGPVFVGAAASVLAAMLTAFIVR